MIAHRFATMPRMDFQTTRLGVGRVGLGDMHIHGSLAQSQPSIPPVERSTGWFWETPEDSPDFIVTESSEDATDAPPNPA